MRAFQALYPGVSVELIATDERLDIAAGEADVALRGSSHPEGAGIVAQRMPDILWTIYCSPAYAAERGVPGSREALRGHEIVGFEGRLTRTTGLALACGGCARCALSASAAAASSAWCRT